MDSSRQLLIAGVVEDPQLAQLLSQAGWLMRWAGGYRQLSSVTGNGYSAGVLLADGQFERQLDKWRDAMQRLDLDWIVVLEPELLQRPQVRRFINEYCYDFHHRPVDTERLLITLGRLYGKQQMRVMPGEHGQGDAIEGIELFGDHPSIRQLKQTIRKIARSEAHILITGESGTGKELAARSIHRLSNRAAAPFQAVNCGGLPVSLVQSELFGYERGAFTGASERRIGYAEAAHGGILFLDEIGDLAAEAQAGLLRFLQEGTVERLGGRQPTQVDVRVISATHVRLEDAIFAGRFREDLFYRLKVCHLHLPALRERVSDILPLSDFLIDRYAGKLGVPKRRLSSDSARAMVEHPWPGNVRELVNRLSQGLVLASGRFIRPADMGLSSGASGDGLFSTLLESRERAEREALQIALAVYNGNSTQAAKMLGISRATFYRLLQKHKIPFQNDSMAGFF